MVTVINSCFVIITYSDHINEDEVDSVTINDSQADILASV